MSTRVYLSEPLLLDEAELTEWWPRARKVFYLGWNYGRLEEWEGWDWKETFEEKYRAKALGLVELSKYELSKEGYQQLLERSLITGYEV